MIKNRLLEYLNKFNILSNCQYVFRKYTSTADDLADVIESVSEHIEHLNICAILLIDLYNLPMRKALDTFDHDILLKNLYMYGNRGTSFAINYSYLSNRMQYIIHNGITSSLNNIKCGVPLGTVFGPILFRLLINDLLNITPILNQFYLLTIQLQFVMINLL